VRRAAEAGLILQGGGHHQAAGLTVACGPAAAVVSGGEARPAEAAARRGVAETPVLAAPVDGAGSEAPVQGLEKLRDWLNDRCSVDARGLEPVHEILARVHTAEAMDRAAKSPGDPNALVKFWCDLYDRFEPFGAGNPRPGLLLKNAELVACQAKTTMKGVKATDGTAGNSTPSAPRVWALSARFRCHGVESLLADWTDPDAARAVWPDPKEHARGAASAIRYNLVLEPHCSSTAGKRGGTPRIWYDWRVVACARSEPAM
jgi:hypothetical protein